MSTLSGVHFTVWTDCRALKFLFSIENPSSRLFRWTLRLQPYSYTVEYKPGTQNQLADAFSRNPVVSHIDVDVFALYQHEIDTYGLKKLRKSEGGLAIVHYKGIDRLVVPQSLVPKVLHSLHDELGHPGTPKTLKLINAQYWWPTRDQDVVQYCKSGHSCQVIKPPHESSIGQLRAIETPDLPNEIWGIDAIVLGSAANSTADKYILTAVDHHSRFVWAVAVKRHTTEAVITFLSRLFDSIGTPDAILSDNGREFVSKRFKDYLKSRGVKHLMTPTYRPQANGICEKVNDSLVKNIKLVIANSPKVKWSTALKTVLNNINDLPHKITGFSPRYLHFGLTSKGQDIPLTTIEGARSQATDRSRKVQTDRKSKHDEKHKKSDFKINDLVKYRIPAKHPSKDKLSPAFLAPCRVMRKLGEESYEIALLSIEDFSKIKSLTVHSSSLLPCWLRSTPQDEFKDTLHDVVHGASQSEHPPPLDVHFIESVNSDQKVIDFIRDRNASDKKPNQSSTEKNRSMAPKTQIIGFQETGTGFRRVRRLVGLAPRTLGAVPEGWHRWRRVFLESLTTQALALEIQSGSAMETKSVSEWQPIQDHCILSFELESRHMRGNDLFGSDRQTTIALWMAGVSIALFLHLVGRSVGRQVMAQEESAETGWSALKGRMGQGVDLRKEATESI